MRLPVQIAAALSACLLAACGLPSDTAPTSNPAVTQAPAVKAKPVDAGTIVKQLQKADLGLKNVATQTEDTDPNNLLGRPNGYLTRASADLPGGDTSGEKYGVDRGLVVETFPNTAAAKTRSEYIQGLQKGNPLLGTEWHYTTGAALVRVSGNVKPSLAKKIEAAVAGL